MGSQRVTHDWMTELNWAIKGVLHVPMNSMAPNLLEKFKSGIHYFMCSHWHKLFIRLFSPDVSCNLPFSMLTQGRCAINSEEASSISREKFDIIWRRPSLYYLWLKYLTLQSSMPLHPQPLYNINCIACISEGKTWVQLKVRELTKITRRVTVLSRGLSCTWVWLTWPPSAIWVQFTKYSSWYLLNI